MLVIRGLVWTVKCAGRLISCLVVLASAAMAALMISGLVGLIVIFVLAPWSIFGFVLGFDQFWHLPLLLAAPTALLVLPVVGVCVPRDGARSFALMLCGAGSGIATILAWEHMTFLGPKPPGSDLLVMAGALAGFVGGGVFGHALNESE